MSVSVSAVADAALSELVEALTFWDRRRIVDLADALLTLALSQEEPCGASMGHDVSTDWLLGVDSVSHATTGVSRHLVSDENCDIELLRDLLESAHDAVENLLALSKLTSARVVNSEGRHDGVDDEQREAVLDHAASCLHQQVDETIDREGSPNHDVVEDALRVKVKSVRDLLDALRPERVLGVDEEHLALAATLRSRELRRDAESVTQLGLAGPELSEGLSDGHAFDTALEQSVELDTARRDALNVLSALKDLHASLEALALNLLSNLIALLSFGLSDTLDVEHLFLGAKAKVQS